MRINNLQLLNFRNYEELELNFSGKSHVIKGNNGIGKSNILEAINLLSTTKSLRTHYDKELIRFEADFTKITGNVTNDDGDAELELTIKQSENFTNASTKTAKVDKVKKSIKNFTGYFNSILFTPADIEILTGSPSLRRRYLDLIFFQFDPSYKKSINDLTKTTRQRNKLLEQINETGQGMPQLEYWDNKLLELSDSIYTKRKSFIDSSNEKINEFSEKLNENSIEYNIMYKASIATADKIEEYRNKEIAAKKTLIGPQRDDFEVILQDNNISMYGSRGQQRTAVLALKLCEMEFLLENTGQRPVLLLDDIYSELDPIHKKAVDNIVDLQQTIITTAFDSKNQLEIIPL